MDRTSPARSGRADPAARPPLPVGPVPWGLAALAGMAGVCVIGALRDAAPATDILLAVLSVGAIAGAGGPRRVPLGPVQAGFLSCLAAQTLDLVLGPVAAGVAALVMAAILGALLLTGRSRTWPGGTVLASAALGACAEAAAETPIGSEAIHAALVLFAILGVAYLALSAFGRAWAGPEALTPAVAVALGALLGHAVHIAPGAVGHLSPVPVATLLLVSLCVFSVLEGRHRESA